MNKQQSTLLNTAHAVQAFLDQNAAVVGPNVRSARRNFDDAVTQLETLAAQQVSSTTASRGATKRLRAVGAFLRTNHMNAIRQVARIALADVPDLNALTVPTRNLSYPRLVAAAQGMADAAARYTSVFTQHGLPDDFAAQLRAAASAVTQVSVARDQEASEVSAATANLLARASRVRTVLKLLNALVVPRLGTDAGLLRKWQTARAIEHQSPVAPVPGSVASATSSPPVPADTSPTPPDSDSPPAD